MARKNIHLPVLSILDAIGLGAVAGLVSGLSASPVVGAVLTMLSGVAAGALTERTGTSEPLPASPRSGAVAAFAAAAIPFLVLGILARSYGWLAPPLRVQVARWTDAQYDLAEAKIIVAAQATGSEIGSAEQGNHRQIVSLKPAESASVPPGELKGSESKASREHSCFELNRAKFDLATAEAAFMNEGPEWKAALEHVKQSSPEVRFAALRSFFAGACGYQPQW